jgi:hypothetical protein
LYSNFFFVIIELDRETLQHAKLKDMLKVQGMDNKLLMKDSWRQDRKDSERLQRQAELEVQFRQIERMTQQDADRLELKKRKADREERLVDTEMQAKRLQNQTQALQLWKEEIKTIMETKRALMSDGMWEDMSDEEKAVFKIPPKPTCY